MTTTTHTTEVITITRRTVLARTIFKARCGCGWKSCETHDQGTATHMAAVHGEVVR